MAVLESNPSGQASLVRQLGADIVSGQHPPGSILPGEFALAGRYNVSRGVIREVLRTLGAKGLWESRRKIGTRVRERRDWNLLDPELLDWMFTDSPPASFVRSLFQLRIIIEPAAAEIAAVKRTAHQLAMMGSALEAMAERGLTSEVGRDADHRFHALILKATHNELLINLSPGIAAAVRSTTFFTYRDEDLHRDPMPQHRDLFEAIAEADANGAKAAAEALIRQAQLDTEAALERSARVASLQQA